MRVVEREPVVGDVEEAPRESSAARAKRLENMGDARAHRGVEMAYPARSLAFLGIL